MIKLNKYIFEKMKQYKIIFADMDDTLIETKSGATFAKTWDDYKFKDEVINKIKEISPKYLFIVTNQGGIGKFIKKEDFEKKLDLIVKYINENTGVKVDAVYCASEDKNNPNRKPNTGMLRHFCESYGLLAWANLSDMLMIGDASGKPGDFSDSDKKVAENFGIDYLDVNDFIK